MIELLITGWIIGSTYYLVQFCTDAKHYYSTKASVTNHLLFSLVLIAASWVLWPILLLGATIQKVTK